jgi:uncharacterized membrane protein YgcG
MSPFGWTWVSDEKWGWAPYHYGTWVWTDGGWGWVPGPITQYWCPAVVSFAEADGGVAWCPLAPGEVRYPPTLALGLTDGNWSLFFSIGQAGCYYPTESGVCLAMGWTNAAVNRAAMWRDAPRDARSNSYLNGHRFVPVNARLGNGTTFASASAFSGAGAYQPIARGDTGAFVRGKAVGAPGRGAALVAGPPLAHVEANSFTPTHQALNDLRAPSQAVSRTLYHGDLAAGRPAVGGSNPAPDRTVRASTARDVLGVRTDRSTVGSPTVPVVLPQRPAAPQTPPPAAQPAPRVRNYYVRSSGRSAGSSGGGFKSGGSNSGGGGSGGKRH